MVRFNFFNRFTGSSILFLGLLLSASTFFFSGCMEKDSNIEELLRLQKEAYDAQLGADTVAIKKYLAEKNITNYKSTKTGLFYTVEVDPTPDNAVPGANEKVRVHYTLWDFNNKKLDSSLDPGRIPLSFTLGAKEVIPGFELGVALMEVGGTNKFYIPSGLAYGITGTGNIPPNTNLIFEVRLLEVVR